jgi:hypothetical protein
MSQSRAFAYLWVCKKGTFKQFVIMHHFLLLEAGCPSLQISQWWQAQMGVSQQTRNQQEKLQKESAARHSWSRHSQRLSR